MPLVLHVPCLCMSEGKNESHVIEGKWGHFGLFIAVQDPQDVVH